MVVSAFESPWSEVYKAVIERLNKEESILEVGCGTGQLAEVLINDGYNYELGFDFSPLGVLYAKRRCKVDLFEVADIYDFDFNREYDTLIAIEVLEHICGDLEMIEKIPSGVRVIFSVPNFNCKGHVRYFKDAGDVVIRYGYLLNNFRLTRIGKIWLIEGVKK